MILDFLVGCLFMIDVVDEKIEKKNEFITPEQFEELFGISIDKQTRLRFSVNYTEKRKAKIPPLPYIRIGKRILYRLESVKEWLIEQERR